MRPHRTPDYGMVARQSVARPSVARRSVARRSAAAPPTLALFAALLCLISPGCVTGVREYFRNGLKVGPNYCPPAAAVSEQWIDYQDPEGRVISSQEPRSDWWENFHDPILTSLVYRAADQNLTLREAGFRILEARALRAIAAGNFFPQTQVATGQYTRRQLSLATGIQAGGGGGFPGITRFFSVWNLGTQLAWELDFWGKYRRAIESADATLDASIENFDDVLVILQGDVADAYVNVRTLEQRIRYAESNVKSQEGSLRFAEVRLKGGAASRLDVTQAITNVAQTSAAIPLFQTQLRQAKNRLCVLLGIPPQDIDSLLGGTGQIPVVDPAVALGIPADLLRRRPDVRRAEREVAAQSARIGIAEADLYPSFTINGALFVQATQFQDLFRTNAIGGAVGPSFSWNILNYGRILNNVRAEEARFLQEIAQYQNVVLNANREAEDFLIGFLNAQLQRRQLERAANAAIETRDLVNEQYLRGIVDFNRVFVAESILAQRQDDLAQSEGSIAQNLIDLYRSLGGGWQVRLDGAGFEEYAVPTPTGDVPVPELTAPPPGEPLPPVETREDN